MGDSNPAASDIEGAPSTNSGVQCTKCRCATQKPEIPAYWAYSCRDLVPGKTYRWCTCGLSKKQPFCDNSHIGTDFKPLNFKALPQSLHTLCGCKYTQDPPFCDASHIKIGADPKNPPCHCNMVGEEW